MTELRAILNRDGSLPVGGIAGGAGLVISFAGRGIILGRVLGDPLPLALILNRLTQGFAYFDWRSPLFHALFAVLLAMLATITTWFMRKEHFSEEGVRRVARIAAAINIGVVAILQVDAVIVAFWYLIAGVMSFYLTSFAAGKTVRLWRRLVGPEN
jgi:hypothetical protein